MKNGQMQFGCNINKACYVHTEHLPALYTVHVQYHGSERMQYSKLKK